MRFKKGDNVVVVNDDHPVSVGMAGLVDGLYQTTVRVDFGGRIDRWWMFPQDLDFSKEHYLTQFYEEVTSAAVAH